MAHRPHIPNVTYQNDLMLQTKHSLPFGSREDTLKVFLQYMGMVPVLVKLTETKCNILFNLTHTPYKI